MGSPSIDARQWTVFLQSMREDPNIAKACRVTGISRSTAQRALGGSDIPEYRKAKRVLEDINPLGPIPFELLDPQAQRAFNDFAFFRRRYFGRVTTPWATKTAHTAAELLETPYEEFVLCNEPPGVGKSTFWTMDFPAWLIVRNRAIRIMLGSAAQTVAKQYAQQLRREFEREHPMQASDDDKKKGLAFDAEATLKEDFGGFKPARGEEWTADNFVVRQPGDAVKGKKEPTVSAYGRDSTFIGHRVDVAIWDDLVSDKNTLNPEARERLKEWWPKFGESRIEPGGLLVLQGQRLHAEDLYHTAELIEVTDYSDADDQGWGEPVGTRRKYLHIKYQAHYDEHCKGIHHPEKAKPYDPDDPDPGCLLDPRRLTFRRLMGIKDQDQRNYVVTYQQEDMDPSSVLVNPLWVTGGKDPVTGEDFPGCWDKDRSMGAVPRLSRPWLSIVTADPSPSKFWSVQWWIYHPQSEMRLLIDHFRGTMTSSRLIDYDIRSQTYEGLLEEWHGVSVAQGAPITHVIVERNAAQKWIIMSKAASTWARTRKVTFIGHDTHGQNKADPKLGVEELIPRVYKYGNVSLPSGDQLSRGRAMALVNEATKYPESGTDDCVMAQWFLEYNLPRLRKAVERPASPPQMRVPSWAKTGVGMHLPAV